MCMHVCMWGLVLYYTDRLNLTPSLATRPPPPPLTTHQQLQWLDSAPHCQNIFSTEYSHIGTGGFQRFWAQNFVKVIIEIDYFFTC